jgi:hypothetical protein
VKVLAIDPGERVGYATASIDLPPDGGSILTVETYGIARLKDFAVSLPEAIKKYDVVIAEDYRISPAKLKIHAGSNVPTIQLLGMIRLCCWLNPTIKFVLQQPVRQGQGTDRIIAANRIFDPVADIIAKAPASHDESHHVSALKHLCFWFWNTYL